jgi:hypothetical protein
MNAVIAGLVVALAQEEEPVSLTARELDGGGLRERRQRLHDRTPSTLAGAS